MKAVVVETGKTLTVRDIQSPQLPEGGAIIKVKGCGICGSDLDKLLNRDLPTGTVLGHEVVGCIETLSYEAALLFPEFPPGQRVALAHHVPCQECYYCLHGSPSMCSAFKASNIFPGGFCEYIAVSGEHLKHTVFPLPDTVSDSEASCIEPLSCCLRAVDRIPKDVGQNVLVIGLGFIGLMTSQYLQYEGYNTVGIDLKPERIAMAQHHGMVHFAATDQTEVLARIASATAGRGADVIFLTIVNPHTLDLAMRAVRDGGTLLLFTSYGKNEPILSQNELYFRELNVITSYSPSLAHLQKAYDLIVQKDINVEPLMTDSCLLTDLPDAMERYRSGEALKVLVTL